VIATPVESHIEAMLELLEVIPTIETVLVEKPLFHPKYFVGTSMLDLNWPASVRMFVGMNWRFHPLVQLIKQEIYDGRFGEIQYASLVAREWVPKIAANAWVESGSHILDTARFLFCDRTEYKTFYWVDPPMVMHINDDVSKAQFVSGLLNICGSEVVLNMESLTTGFVAQIHVNCCNRDEYDYRIVIQGSRRTGRYQIPGDPQMHFREMQSFLGDQQGLATLQDGIENVRLLAAGL
jgi:predicted dehydrogenase